MEQMEAKAMVSETVTWVGLIPGDSNLFRRAVRDAAGSVTEVLRFAPDAPLSLDTEQLAVVSRDIGRVLCFCVPTDEAAQKFRVDWDKTHQHHESQHGTAMPTRVKLPVNVSAPAKATVVVDANEAEEQPVELSDELMNVLERHSEQFEELTPEGLRAFVDGGGSFESLDGFTTELVKEIHEALAVGPDLSRLIAAGIEEEVARKLAANIRTDADRWLLDPVEIKAKVASGFKLEKLDGIGRVTAKLIVAAI